MRVFAQCVQRMEKLCGEAVVPGGVAAGAHRQIQLGMPGMPSGEELTGIPRQPVTVAPLITADAPPSPNPSGLVGPRRGDQLPSRLDGMAQGHVSSQLPTVFQTLITFCLRFVSVFSAFYSHAIRVMGD